MPEISEIRVKGIDHDVRDTSKVPVNQGTANAGKIMQVGADGNLAPTAALDGKVDKTQTVNGKALNTNITLDANDIPYDDDPEAQRIVGSVGSALFQRPKYNKVVRVDGEQSLTDAQKATARGNIDAASVEETSGLKNALDFSIESTIKYYTQYLVAENIISNKYWYNDNSIIRQTEHQVLSSFYPFKVKAGRYYFADLSNSYVFIVNESTSAISKLSQFDTVSQGYVDIESASIIYVSFESAKYSSVYFSDHVIYNDNVPRGRYSVLLSDDLTNYIVDGEVHHCTFQNNGYYRFYRSINKGDAIKLYFDTCSNPSVLIYLQALTGNSWINVIDNLVLNHTQEYVATQNFDDIRVAVGSPSSTGTYILTFVSPIKLFMNTAVDAAVDAASSSIRQIQDDVYGITTTVDVTAAYKTKEYPFEQGHFYRFTLISNTSENKGVNLNILDSNSAVINTLYLTKVSATVIYCIESDDAVAVRFGASGTAIVSINDMGGILEKGREFWCGPNRSIKTLKEGIETAMRFINSTLYVDAGTYNLINEFGSDFFENLSSNNVHSGLKLGNNIHIIFSPDSKVVSNYTGDNQYAQSYYSPFNATDYGFTVENLTLECSRCRYCVHDEQDGKLLLCKSEYINCSMKIDNTDNDYWPQSVCIGGGLGSNHYVDIRGCIFDGPDDATARGQVYYHWSNDSSNPNHFSIVNIHDNFLKKGTIAFDQGSSTIPNKKSRYIVTNNSVKKVAGTQTNGLIYNGLFSESVADVYVWNNEIRD